MRDDKRRAPRRLTHAEHELWTIVTADVQPFRARAAALERPSSVAPPPPVADPRAGLPAYAPTIAPAPAPRATDIDYRTHAKIRRGRLEVDAKLDLHGMRQAEAQRALIGFLRRAQAEGAKIAIIVTGKGLSREEGGVLRRVVPLWLQAPGLRDLVVGFGEAARHHGGEGALYVRIRRAGRF